MLYPHKAGSARTEKVSLRGQRIVDLGNQRVLEKRQLAQSNFSKKSEAERESLKTSNAQVRESKLTTNRKATLCTNRTVEVTVARCSPVLQSQAEYIAVLEQSISELKGKLRDSEKRLLERSAEKQLQNGDNQQFSIHQNFKQLQLERYYCESRKLLLTCSMELIDCKALLLSQSQPPSERIDSIGMLLHRNEMLLKTYNCYEEVTPQLGKQQRQQAEAMVELEQLRQVTSLQEKTIQQLRGIRPIEEQLEGQRRLLRHETNRLFNENELLRQHLDEKYAEFFENLRNLSTVTLQSGRYLHHYFDIFAENSKLREDVHCLTVEKNYIEERLIQQKDCAGKLAEELKRIRDGQSTPAFREEYNPQLEVLQKTISDLREKLLVTETLLEEANSRLHHIDEQATGRLLTPSRMNNQPDISFSANNSLSPIATKDLMSLTKDSAYDTLTDRLAAYPDILALFHKYSTECDITIGNLREELEHEKQDKERTLRWCKKTYELLKRSNLPESEIEAHLRLLYELDKREKYTRIKNLLCDIEGLAEGFDRYQRKEVEEELSEYVSALKKRGQTIKQVENEDGSSVMPNDCQSEAFTDMQRSSDSQI